MEERCARCGRSNEETRWCATCGADLRPGEAVLPTDAALEAGRREQEWLAGNPEIAESERAEKERVYRQQAQANAEEVRREWERRAVHRPPQFDTYRNRDWLSLLTRRWLALVVVATAVVGVVELLRLRLLGGRGEDEYATSEKVLANDGWLGLTYVSMLLFWIVAAGLFIAWLFRAYKNVQALGARQMRFGNGWVIGGWFVPILTLWRPKQIVNDVWRASDAALPADAPSARWVEHPVPPLINAWWALFILGEVITRISLQTGTSTLSDARAGTIVDLIWCVVQIAAGVLAIRLVTLTTRRVQARAERISALPQLPAEQLAA